LLGDEEKGAGECLLFRRLIAVLDRKKEDDATMKLALFYFTALYFICLGYHK